MISITNLWTSQMQKLANFIVLEGENKGFYWYALIQTIFVLTGDLWMKKRLLNLLIEYTRCSVSIKRRKDFIGMDMAGNSLRWDSPCQTVCQSLFGTEICRKWEVSPCEEDCSTNVKARSAKIFKKEEIKVLHTGS